MNEKQIAESFYRYRLDEDLQDTLFEFNFWIDHYADAVAVMVVESMGVEEFYGAYVK